MHKLASVKIFFVLLLLASSFSATPNIAFAQSPEPVSPLPYDEAEAHTIDGLIMCPVCPAETIDQAQVPIARQMRQIVRDMLAQGATREDILDFFAQRYGPEILAAPPKSGFNLVAWVLPPVSVVLALAAGVLVLRSMMRNKSPVQPAAVGIPTDESLQPYLELVDQQMALRQTASGTAGPVEADESPRREEDRD